MPSVFDMVEHGWIKVPWCQSHHLEQRGIEACRVDVQYHVVTVAGGNQRFIFGMQTAIPKLSILFAELHLGVELRRGECGLHPRGVDRFRPMKTVLGDFGVKLIQVLGAKFCRSLSMSKPPHSHSFCLGRAIR